MGSVIAEHLGIAIVDDDAAFRELTCALTRQGSLAVAHRRWGGVPAGPKMNAVKCHKQRCFYLAVRTYIVNRVEMPVTDLSVAGQQYR